MYHSQATDEKQRDIAEAALFYLMSKFARSPNAWLAYAVVEHLHMLLRWFDESNTKYSAYAGLLPVWERLIPEYQLSTQQPIVLARLTEPAAANIH